MHDTAKETGRAFFATYATAEAGIVLDVGSLDINGTLRPFVPVGWKYCGVDLAPGPNVNVVLDESHHLPFPDSDFDIVVSTSCFEHDAMFWLTFAEMARVVKPNGVIYVSAPVQGPVHRHPIDAWRFYPDAGSALGRWAQFSGYPISLLESFILPPGGEGWSDFVAVWAKQAFEPRRDRISDQFPMATHIR